MSRNRTGVACYAVGKSSLAPPALRGSSLCSSALRPDASQSSAECGFPFARGYTAYLDADNQELLTAALAALIERFKLRGERLGDVIAGAVSKHPKDFNLTRESVLSSSLDPHTPGLDVQRACGTSLEAAILVANKIALGQIEVGIAGGVDTVSDPPVMYPRSFQRLLLRSARGRRPDAAARPVDRAAPARPQADAAGGGRAADRTVDG